MGSGEEMTEFLSDDDLRKTPPASDKTMLSDDDLKGPRSAESLKGPGAEGKFLDNNNVDDPFYKWVPKKVATAAIKGVMGLPGIPGDLADMAGLGMAGVEAGGRSVLSRLGAPVDNLSTVDIMKRNEANLHKAGRARVQAPSTQQIYEGLVKPWAGEYVGDTKVGRAVDAGLQAVFTPTPTGKGLQILKQGIRHAAPNFIGGSLGQGVTEATGNPVLGAAVGLPAAVVAGKVAQTGETYARTAATAKARDEAARGLAGEVYREGAENPDRARTNLGDPSLNPDLNGFESTTAQRAQDKGVSGVENRLGQMATKAEGPVNYNQEIEQQKAAQQQAVADAAANAKTDVEGRGLANAEGQTGVTPLTKAESSDRVATIKDAAEQAAKSVENTAWDNWRQSGGTVYTNRIINKINDIRDSLPPSERVLVERALGLANEDLQFSQTGKTSPVEALQKVRTGLLTDARGAGVKGDFTTQNVLNGVAAKLKDVLTDKSNYQSGKGSQKLWQDAVDATNDRHNVWDTASLKRQGRLDETGQPRVAPEELLKDTFRGANAIQKTEQLVKAVGSSPELTRQMQDWHMADLTDGGTKIPNEAAMTKWMATHAGVIDQIPGLKLRLENFKGLSQADRVMEMFQLAAPDPKKFLRFLDANRQTVAEVGQRTGQADLFNKLELAAREIDTKVGGKPMNADTLTKLSEGRLVTLLYGSMTEKVGMGAVGAIAGHVLGNQFGLTTEILTAAGGAAGILGSKARLHSFIESKLGRLLTRDIQERTLQLLQESRSNPELAKSLMETASPQKIKDLYGNMPIWNTIRQSMDAKNDEGDPVTGPNEITVNKSPAKR